MNKRTRIIAVVLVVVMLLGLVAGIVPTLVGAADASSSEIKSQIDELEDEKDEIDANIKELEGQLSENLTEMETIVAQKNVIDQEIFLYHEKIVNINSQIAAYSQLIADKQEELEGAEENLEQMRLKHQDRLRAMEEEGDISYWTVIFEAENFSDLLDRFAMVEELQEADEKRIQEMSDAAEAVVTAKAELETEKAALETMKTELETSQKTLEEKRLEADKLLADLMATGEEYQTLLDEAESESSRLQTEIANKEVEYDEAKDREYKAWLATSVPPTTTNPSYSNGGTAGDSNIDATGITWLVPVNYTRFSSPYGYRIHPIYGTWKFHAGVDLAAASGTPIVASRAGRVKYATYDSSSGYYVTLDHLDGFETKYLHMTHYIVAAGDYVSAGQVIGYVGSTGASTGPHLHFGVYYNGSSVNPANYINF